MKRELIIPADGYNRDIVLGHLTTLTSNNNTCKIIIKSVIPDKGKLAKIPYETLNEIRMMVDDSYEFKVTEHDFIGVTLHITRHFKTYEKKPTGWVIEDKTEVKHEKSDEETKKSNEKSKVLIEKSNKIDINKLVEPNKKLGTLKNAINEAEKDNSTPLNEEMTRLFRENQAKAAANKEPSLDDLISKFREPRRVKKNKKTSKIDFFSATEGELSLADILLRFTTNGRNERFFYYRKLNSIDDIFGKVGVKFYKWYYKTFLIESRLTHILEQFKKDNFRIVFTGVDTNKIDGMTRDDIKKRLEEIKQEIEEKKQKKNGKNNNTRRSGTNG